MAGLALHRAGAARQGEAYAIPFIASSVLLFLLGGLIAYLTLGKALEFLIAWSGADVGAAFQVSKYIRLVGLMVAAFGVGFQFPVLLVFLQLVGVLTPQTLIKQWRYAIVVHLRRRRRHHAVAATRSRCSPWPSR